MEKTALYEKPVIGKENWILRNLQITQSYHELAIWLRKVIGRENVSWVAFATYASKMAGYTIRHEQLPEAVNDLATRLTGKNAPKALALQHLSDPATRQAGGQFGVIENIYLRISNNVSRGNAIVYEELAPLFRGFVDAFQDDFRYKEAKLQRFLAKINPGPTLEGGQEFVIEAFTNYYQARFELKAKRKAEKIFLANLLIGLHEQTRLQPVIEDAMSALIAEVVEGVPRWMARWIGTPAVAQQSLLAVMKDWLTIQLTSSVMCIELPGLLMRLNEDVKVYEAQPHFPEDLERIENPRVREILQQWDTSEDTLTGSAAKNWVSLQDRMNFIMDLFRSHQQNTLLYTPPFTETQEKAIRANLIPEGKL